MYAYVESGSVKKVYNSLPRTWRNISNFYSMDTASLASHGWLPITIEDVTFGQYETYGSTSYTITSTSVTESRSKRAMTQEEINTLLDSVWSFIRAERDQKLRDSDWTQMSDSPLTNPEKGEWATYRQSLRDITSQPLQYDGQTNTFSVTWPTEPTTQESSG